MLILFPFFRQVEHPRSNCAVLSSAVGRGRHERPHDVRVHPYGRGPKSRRLSRRFAPKVLRLSCRTFSFSPSPFSLSTSSRCDVDDFQMNSPFRLEYIAIVSTKLQLQLQLPLLTLAAKSVSPAMAARRFLPSLDRSLNLRRLRLLKSQEVRRVSPSRRYTRGT